MSRATCVAELSKAAAPRGRDVEQRHGVGARNDQRVPFGCWREVEKGRGTFVFVYDVGRPKSAHDVAEQARLDPEGHSAVVRSTSIVAASSGAPIRSQTSSVRSSSSKSKKARRAASYTSREINLLAAITVVAVGPKPPARRRRNPDRISSTTFSMRNSRHSSPRPTCSEADNVQAIGSDVTKRKLAVVSATANHDGRHDGRSTLSRQGSPLVNVTFPDGTVVNAGGRLGLVPLERVREPDFRAVSG